MASSGMMISFTFHCICSLLHRQQLYYLFTPFVLFGEMITTPTSKTCIGGLRLLRQTVLNFLGFQRHHASAVKLEMIEETFTTTVEATVRHSFITQSWMTTVIFDRPASDVSQVAVSNYRSEMLTHKWIYS